LLPDANPVRWIPVPAANAAPLAGQTFYPNPLQWTLGSLATARLALNNGNLTITEAIGSVRLLGTISDVMGVGFSITAESRGQKIALEAQSLQPRTPYVALTVTSVSTSTGDPTEFTFGGAGWRRYGEVSLTIGSLASEITSAVQSLHPM
jgi:hypothetical protein